MFQLRGGGHLLVLLEHCLLHHRVPAGALAQGAQEDVSKKKTITDKPQTCFLQRLMFEICSKNLDFKRFYASTQLRRRRFVSFNEKNLLLIIQGDGGNTKLGRSCETCNFLFRLETHPFFALSASLNIFCLFPRIFLNQDIFFIATQSQFVS